MRQVNFPPHALRRRQFNEKSFRFGTRMAIVVAVVFLVFFLFDIGRQGFLAFVQTNMLVEIRYNEEAKERGLNAVAEELQELVSRGFSRIIPMRMEDNPELMGVVREEWVLSTAEVDQYMKGKANRLKQDEKDIVDAMVREGRMKLRFNWGFFLNGDSKLPEMAGMKSAIVGSLYVMIITLLLSFPVGVLSAVYLEEFAPDNRFTQIIEININNLAAIPSIIFGLLGLAIFINFFGVARSSSLVGGLTLSLMTLPTIIISTRASIRAIPDSIREAALALGATRWQMVWDHVLPLALPGVLTGSIIGLARAMGETAPLLIVGMMAYIPDSPSGFSSAATVMPAQIYTWSSDSMRAFTERTAAGIIVLLAVLLTLNATAILLRNKFERKW